MALVWAINSMASQEVFNELTLAMQCSAVINHFRYEDLAPEGAWRHHLTLQTPDLRERCPITGFSLAT